ncbi:MAG TPA: nuclear transport factor 2 family protein [Vicinamibacteria bacterium]|nr:nuclear transport factor 2 family protein [Vicinamibacteria bacterium]
MTKERAFLVPALLCVAPLLLLAGPAEDEAAVWQLEETYWKCVKARDLDAYRSLWDERFVGWPSFSAQPLGKAQIADWIPPLHADPSRRYDYELKREAVRAFGDIVVVHYRYMDVYRNAETGEVLEKSAWKRITHTWQRRGDGWQIVTGMSASYDH